LVDDNLNYEIKGHVAVFNFFGPINLEDEFFQLSYKIHDFCTEIASNKEIRVVIFADAVEGAFCLHEDLISARGVPSLAEPLSNIDRPVIAAITGDALGQGLELTLACDIRIVSETSCFGFPQIKKGFIPGDGGTQRLSRLIGKGKALEMILTGRNVDAQEAYRIGLVNKTMPRDEVIGAAMDMAKEMATKGPIALRYSKEAIAKGMDMTLEQGLRLEADLYLLVHTTKDRTEGIEAFRGKKKVEFKGE
jgi:enoyl-CoA hydratase/carnithine racemase